MSRRIEPRLRPLKAWRRTSFILEHPTDRDAAHSEVRAAEARRAS
jgi:hypothetical protein